MAVVLILPATVGSAYAQESVFFDTEPVPRRPGEPVKQPIAWQPVSGVRMQIALGNAPRNARLTVSDAGQLLVLWQPELNQPVLTVVELLAHDIDTGELLDRETITFNLSDDSPSLDDDGNALSSTLSQPVMTALVNQMVSPGRVVSFRVDASTANGPKPELQVDRLPRNASFDANADGSRTFHWLTSDSDQGEHLFRFSAIHPDNLQLRTRQEIVIIVGDLSRKKTIPTELSITLDE